MKVTGVILAAGLASRMGGVKMNALFQGKPLVDAVINAAKSSYLHEIIIVTGHEKINANILQIQNLHPERGLSSSLKLGLETVKTNGALILLGDMPLVRAAQINAMLEKFTNENDIIVPTFEGDIGNPILWGRGHFSDLLQLQGDKGARNLLGEKSKNIKYITLDQSILRDFDTKESLNEALLPVPRLQ